MEEITLSVTQKVLYMPRETPVLNLQSPGLGETPEAWPVEGTQFLLSSAPGLCASDLQKTATLWFPSPRWLWVLG